MPTTVSGVREKDMGLADGGFKNPGRRQRYDVVYDEARALSPLPDAELDVPTDFGDVRVYRHGPAGGTSVVLIHGFFLTSAMWWEQVAGLADEFTVYTLDMLGQPGRSSQSAALRTPGDCASVIDAVLQRLKLDDAHLVGHSYGGWLATHTAALAPDRVRTLTLIDPAHTVVRLDRRFWRGLAVLLTRPRSTGAARAASWITGQPESGSAIATLTRLFLAGFDAFSRPRTAPIRLASDDLLRSVRRPVQVLLAGNTIHDSTMGVSRVGSVVPEWQHRLWPSASHFLPAEFPDDVNQCIRDFADQHSR